MKIVIEDYYGNDLCSFVINPRKENNGIDCVAQFVDCSYADMEQDENSEPYNKKQIENGAKNLFEEKGKEK